MRDYLLLYINGKRYQISDNTAGKRLSDFLRHDLGLTGTKVVCAEGACGACSVLVGKPNTDALAGELRYQTVNACLLRVFQADCCHIVTVEGLKSEENALSPVQQAVVKNHGTQCGYCTPGVVISLTALAQAAKQNAKTDGSAFQMGGVRDALSGNLCRCTGYLPIQEAGLSLADLPLGDLFERYPAAPMMDDFARHAALSARFDLHGGHALCIASTVPDALAFLAEFPHAKIVAGGTGVLPDAADTPCAVLSVGGLRELSQAEILDNVLSVGATVTWAQLERETRTLFPELARLLPRFGSPQIRNQGTIGGSVAQADANSDWLPLLLVQNAVVHLASAQNGERTISCARFLLEKCAPGELLIKITIPLPAPGERMRLYKVTRRKGFDRSVFCAAVNLRVAPGGSIADARVACGGVGPQPMRLSQTEAFLAGAPYSEETMQRAGAIAASEITPADDAYAGANYRRQLAARLTLRFFHDDGATDEGEYTVA